jgi:DNA-binding transcriptional regulator YiaG
MYGVDIFHLNIEQENQNTAFAAYRAKYGLLKPNEIKAIRNKYQLSEHDFSLFLGFGPKTIARFERGSLQTPKQNQKISEIKNILRC